MVIVLNQRNLKRSTLTLLALVAILCITFFISLGTGAIKIRPDEVIRILTNVLNADFPFQYDNIKESVLVTIRLPRVLLGILVGSALAVSGGALQGLFRNPLADPGLIGVSTGAALAAATTIVCADLFSDLLFIKDFTYVLPGAAFTGAMCTTLLIYRISKNEGRTNIATMLLAGIAINAIAASGIGLLIFASDDQQLRDLNFWMLGSLGGATWETILPASLFILPPSIGLIFYARQLDALLLGEVEAYHLGFDIESLKLKIIILVALSVGTAVALTGVIGFIGLVVPHLIRIMIGPLHTSLLPASMLLGSILLLISDLAARTSILPAELPIGILTSCIGGPFFLWLLITRRGWGVS